MRLDFTILWVEDHPDNMQSAIEPIERRMRAQGFKLGIIWAKTVAEAKAKLAENVLRDNIDLILVDYNLGEGPNGDVALREIRNQLEYREMVFYSAKSPGELRELANKQGVDGVYFASREDGGLVEAAYGVFETLVKKVLDIDHTRGIVMGASSDIEHIVHDALLALYAQHDADGKSAFKQSVLKRIDVRLRGYEKTTKAAVEDGTIEKLLDLRDVVNSHTKLEILAELLKAKPIGEEQGVRNKIRSYTFETVPKRNKLAHITVTVNESGARVLVSRDGAELTEEQLRELRCELLDHRENFHLLSNLLRGLAT